MFTDASFANNKDLSLQISYVLALANATNKANIVHWSSVKCKRVTRSVLASELYSTVHSFNISVAVKTMLDKILQINLPVILCTDSKSLYDCLIQLRTRLANSLVWSQTMGFLGTVLETGLYGLVSKWFSLKGFF